MATSTITLKTDTTVNWEASNRILVMNEPALERTESGLVNMKIGDGVHTWNELDYVFELATLQDIKDYVTAKYNSVVQIADNLTDNINTAITNANTATSRANTAAAAAEDVVADKVGINDTTKGAATTYSSNKIQEMVDSLTTAIGAMHIDSWSDVQKIVEAGLGATAFPVGTQFATATTDTAFKDSSTNKMYWDVVAHQDITTPEGETKPAMILMAHYASGTGIMSDQTEATYYAPEGLAAGTYWFGIPVSYTSIDSSNGNQYNDLVDTHVDDYQIVTYTDTTGAESEVSVLPIQFTITSDIPAGGAFRLGWNYRIYLSASTITTYSAKGCATTIESGIPITVGTNGTYLGSANTSYAHGNFNGISRFRYGSNNWSESNIRQWLNAESVTGTWYTPSTRFDRNGISRNGFIYGLQQAGETDFLSVVKPIRHITVTNNYWEEGDVYDAETSTHSRIGRYDTTDDRFWLASNSEIFDTKEGIVKDGTLFSYFGAKTNACRIKYNNAGNNTAGSAQYWWLRSPYVGYTYSVRYVSSSGAVNTSTANYTYRPAPACAIY